MSKWLARSLLLLVGFAVFAGIVWFVAYRDTTKPPWFEEADFSGLTMQDALAKLADATVEGGAPGIIVHAVVDGTVYEATSGTRNKNTGGPMPADHPLRMASISKLYTAGLIHHLIAEGQLSLDDKISDVLPAEVMAGMHNGAQITIRHLLLHTGGLPDYYDVRHYLFGEWKSAPLTLERVLPVSRRGKPTGQAGEVFAYSNIGYILLGRVAEEVSGETYEGLLERVLLAHIGAERTTYNVKHPVADSIYGVGTILRPWADTWNYWEHSGPDAGVMAPASEIAEFLGALFLPDGALKRIGDGMLAEQIASYSEQQVQGLGPHLISGRDGTRLIGHSGDVFGYQTVAYVVPERDYVFVAHINCDCDAMSGSLIGNLIRLERGVSGE